MIDIPAWSIQKEETIYKAAGAVNLQRYGQFFQKLAEKSWVEPSDFNDIYEGPIRLVYKIDEDENFPKLAKSDNKIFYKLLVSVGGICREIRLLKAESSKFYSQIFYQGEQCNQPDFKIESLLSDLQDLSNYTNRISVAIDLAVKQLSKLAKNSSYREIYLPLLIENLLDLFIILLKLDEIIYSYPGLIEKWKIYCIKIKSVLHNSAQFNIPEEKLLIYENLLKDLYIKLFSKNLFSRAMEAIVNINKPNSMCDQIVCHLKNSISDIDQKINNNTVINRNLIQVNIGIVLLVKLYGSDKKLLKKVVEINKKVYAISLIGNIIWLPNDFLADCLAKQNLSVTAQDGEKVLNMKIQKLPQVTNNLIQKAIIWNIEMHSIMIKTGFQIFSEIERKKILLTEIIVLLQQMKENISIITNLHAFFLKPMSRGIVQLICRLIEVQKSLESTFHSLALTILLSQSQILQQLTYQILSVLKNVYQNLLQKDRNYNKDKADALSLIIFSMKLINGTLTVDRRLILRCILVCASQLTDNFKEENIVKLRFYLDTYDLIVDLYNKISEESDYTIILHHQNILPAYFSLALDSNSNISHIVHLFNAFNSAVNNQESKDLFKLKIVEQRKILMQNVMETTCREIETNLRLHVHAHLKLNSTNPFKIGAKNYNRIVRSYPLAINDAVLYTKRYMEHYLDYTFYNLTTVTLYDWRTYKTMHAIANYKFGLDTVQNHLPTQTLGQGADALEIMRNINVFVSKYLYNLHTQTFMEFASTNKHLNTFGIKHIAQSIHTHGTGIMSTTVNYVYQFLKVKLYTFSQFLFDEHIKSRLMRDVRYIRLQREKNVPPYSYERAEKFQKGIRKLGMTADGLSYLDQFRQVITQIGNALGYVRLIRSGALYDSSNAISFLPDVNSSAFFDTMNQDLNFSSTTQAAAKCLENDISNLVKNFTEGIHYFKLLLDVFASALRDGSKYHHLKSFYAIIPPLTLSFVDNAVSNKEKLFKKNKSGAAFTDDGFSVGVAYICSLLDQSNELDNLQWFQTVDQYYNSQKVALEQKKEYEDEKLQQTQALALKRLEERSLEFRFLFYSLSGAKVFFK